MPYYQRGPWLWNDLPIPAWRAPVDGHVGLVDLRTLPEQASPGVDGELAGDGLFAYETEQPGLVTLTDDPVVAGAWLAAQFAAGDAAGQTDLRPLLPTDRRWQIYLGGLIYDAPLSVDPAEPQWAAALRVLQHDYAAIRVQSAEHGDQTFKKVLGFWARQYGVDYRTFLGRLPDEGVLDPETTITETFNKADGALGPNLTWTNLDTTNIVVASNFAYVINPGPSYATFSARADTNLSSADHYAQILRRFGPNLGGWWDGPMVRKDATSTNTNYVCLGGQIGLPYLYKLVSGVGSSIGSVSSSEAWFTPVTLYLSAVGSTVAVKLNGTPTDSVTDTSITAGLRTGFSGYIERDGFDMTWDDFEAGDLGGPTGTLLVHPGMSGRMRELTGGMRG